MVTSRAGLDSASVPQKDSRQHLFDGHAADSVTAGPPWPRTLSVMRCQVDSPYGITDSHFPRIVSVGSTRALVRVPESEAKAAAVRMLVQWAGAPRSPCRQREPPGRGWRGGYRERGSALAGRRLVSTLNERAQGSKGHSISGRGMRGRAMRGRAGSSRSPGIRRGHAVGRRKQDQEPVVTSSKLYVYRSSCGTRIKHAALLSTTDDGGVVAFGPLVGDGEYVVYFEPDEWTQNDAANHQGSKLALDFDAVREPLLLVPCWCREHACA
eukprot:482655-Prymnesium_polylepis.2